MSDLTAFRDHARRMSEAQHVPECRGTPEVIAADERDQASYRRIFGESRPGLEPIEPCPECVTDADRALWARLADEADAYLGRHVEEGLFA